MNGFQWQPVPSLRPYVDAPGNSPRVNDLMRRNWALIDQAAELVNDTAGRVSREQDELLQEIWEETLDIERKYAETLTAENIEYHRASHVEYFGENYAQLLGWA